MSDLTQFEREGRGLEFDRVSFFTDAIYAIAMTLLVVDLKLPETAPDLNQPGNLLQAIGDVRWQIFGFFLGFLLIGRYWLMHHMLFAKLKSIDQTLVKVNLAGLGFVAFSPFSVMLISRYEDNWVAFLIFAGNLAMISGLKLVLLILAARRGHFADQPASFQLRHDVIDAAIPVAVMLLSLPLAAISTSAALLSWLLIIPFSAFTDRRFSLSGDPGQAAQ